MIPKFFVYSLILSWEIYFGMTMPFRFSYVCCNFESFHFFSHIAKLTWPKIYLIIHIQNENISVIDAVGFHFNLKNSRIFSSLDMEQSWNKNFLANHFEPTLNSTWKIFYSRFFEIRKKLLAFIQLFF